MKKRSQPVDVHVGMRIRQRRTQLGMSQTTIAEGLGITFQQIQKYEKGTNRVGASRLQAIANILKVDAAYFFEGNPGVPGAAPAPEPEPAMSYALTSEGMDLLRAVSAIPNAVARRQIINMAKTIAGHTDAATA
jgi:transcriptional regulator with XRE-family HTH domain